MTFVTTFIVFTISFTIYSYLTFFAVFWYIRLLRQGCWQLQELRVGSIDIIILYCILLRPFKREQSHSMGNCDIAPKMSSHVET